MNYQTQASGIFHMSCLIRLVKMRYVSENPKTWDITMVKNIIGRMMKSMMLKDGFFL